MLHSHPFSKHRISESTGDTQIPRIILNLLLKILVAHMYYLFYGTYLDTETRQITDVFGQILLIFSATILNSAAKS